MFERKTIAEGGLLEFDPNFLTSEEADKFLNLFIHSINWTQKHYTNFKTREKMPVPRMTAWYADDSKMEYVYSGIKETVSPWTPELLSLKEKIEKETGSKYNSVLLNLYRDQNDSVGLHADNEKELGTNANIASLSLGGSRWFKMEQVKTSDGSKPSSKTTYLLTHGSLLVMSGTTQHYWKHEIPKMPGNVVKPRINLTYRYFHKSVTHEWL